MTPPPDPPPKPTTLEPAAGVKAAISLSVRAGPVFSPCRHSVSPRRDAGQAAEHRGEVTRGPKSDQPRDVCDGQVLPRQAGAGPRDSLPDHEPMWRDAGAVFEETREVVGLMETTAASSSRVKPFSRLCRMYSVTRRNLHAGREIMSPCRSAVRSAMGSSMVGALRRLMPSAFAAVVIVAIFLPALEMVVESRL